MLARTALAVHVRVLPTDTTTDSWLVFHPPTTVSPALFRSVKSALPLQQALATHAMASTEIQLHVSVYLATTTCSLLVILPPMTAYCVLPLRARLVIRPLLQRACSVLAQIE